jgi:hypothetical protein
VTRKRRPLETNRQAHGAMKGRLRITSYEGAGGDDHGLGDHPGGPCRTRRRRWSCGRSRPGRHTAIPRWPRSRILNAAASVSRSERIRECWRGSADRASGVRTPLSDRSYTFGRDIGQAVNRGQHLVTRCYEARLLRAGASLAQHRGLPSRDRCLHRRRDDAHPFAAWLRPP